MSNFVIECPTCGAMHPASNSFFAKKTIKCTCGRTIDLRKDSLRADECSHCGNKIIIDARKGDKAICPICGKPVHTQQDITNFVSVRCPKCACEVTAKKPRSGGGDAICPICQTKIDVYKAIQINKLTEENRISVIKYEGDNDTLVWKHPVEDFNTGSQLIVHESQVAVFFRDGIALDTFPSGAYTLTTKTLPLVGNTMKLPTDNGADSIFHAEVYFINMVTHLGYKWGTPSRIRLVDPVTKMNIDIGARGSMNIRICDARKLLNKLIGTGSVLSRNDLQNTDESGKSQQSVLATFFRDIIVSRVRTYIPKTIKNENINLMEIDERMEDMSASLQILINEALEEFGFALDNFMITDVDLPTDNPEYMKLKKLNDQKILALSQKDVERDLVMADAEIAYAKKSQEHNINLMSASNEAQVARISVEKARAEAEALIAQAQAEAEKTRLTGVASVDVYAAQAQAEAREMHAKGYTYQQETSRQIGLEAMQNGLPGTGNSGSGAGGAVSSAVGDMISLGVTLGAVGSVAGMARDTMAPIIHDIAQVGKQINDPNAWTCACGKAGITSRFCPECGSPKPAPVVATATWNCACGCTNITSKFCPDCGMKNPAIVETWDCKNCGTLEIKSKFCPNCGHPKEV